MPSVFSASWAARSSRESRVWLVQAVPQKTRVALVEAPMGAMSLSYLRMVTSWASSTSSRAAGGGADDVAFRRAGEEGDARLPHTVELPASLIQSRRVSSLPQHLFQPAHGVERLRLQGGGDLDHLHRVAGEERQQVDLQLRLQFVLAGLAREHDHELHARALMTESKMASMTPRW